MSLKQIWIALERFWFAEGSPVPVALFRILWGLIVLTFCWWIAPELPTYFGQHAIISPAVSQLSWGAPRLDLLSLFPRDDVWLWRMYWLLVVAALFLTIGLFSRISAFTVYLILLTLLSRNWCILKLVVDIMLLMALYLAVSRCGEALSIDRLLKIWIGPNPEYGKAKPGNIIGQRLIQIQIAIVYWSAFSAKLHGMSWIDGSAVYYATHWLPNQQHQLPIPHLFDNLLICQLLSWSTLLIEFSLCSLVWVKELCYPILLIGLLFHLGLNWGVFIPLLQYVMVGPYVTFIDARDLSKVMDWIKRPIQKLIPSLRLGYDGSLDVNCRLAETIRRLDIFGLVELQDVRTGTKGIFLLSSNAETR